MTNKNLFLGKNSINSKEKPVKGEYLHLDGEPYYRISNFDQMDPFFMSIVSNSDHWMFISSNGGLTAGRKNADNALFPYYNDDIVHDSSEKTGSKSIFRVSLEDKTYLWEPFSNSYFGVYAIQRNIYKNIPGNKVLFEEINHDLGLTFSYLWLNSERFGFVRKSKITNHHTMQVAVEFLDGIQNILPFGIHQQFQLEFSTLADGYKKNELIQPWGLGVYALSSIPCDKAEPSESLKATTVWSTGVDASSYLLSSSQIQNFRMGYPIENETDQKAQRGAYFLNSEITLDPESTKEWLIVAEVSQGSSCLAELIELMRSDRDLLHTVMDDVEKGTHELIKIIAASDGLQLTQDMLGTSRHFSNVLFNVMRGGIFGESYQVDKRDFMAFIKTANHPVFQKHEAFLVALEESMEHATLLWKVKGQEDRAFIKLSYEYLPLTFSRRHGDPSRPWNRFSIEILDERKNKVRNYQGNWRDIFQNWEALSASFPEFIESFIAKFLNGSTADGYNPYRVTRDGFDWEVPEPHTPWANIGYWGDHQIIYLLKLLECSFNHDPSKLTGLLEQDIFAYANVPYKIMGYEELLRNPHHTIEFDHDLHREIENAKKEIGSDARYLTQPNGSLYLVNLAEKLLVTLLSKLCNFIPGGGIWMNTQRPEWNDANNALVGHGVSMVTLYYLRRYVAFLINLFSTFKSEKIDFSLEIKTLLEDLYSVFSEHEYVLESSISDQDRKTILDGLGTTGSRYRQSIYANGFCNNKEPIEIKNILQFLRMSQMFIEHTIRFSRREDGLYHSYNLMAIENEHEIKISRLYEMLEGQVAVLSSGFLKTAEAINLISTLRSSVLYREDQNSYILYPDRDLPRFLDKNNVSHQDFMSSRVMQLLVEQGNHDIVIQDLNGVVHFNGEIRNAAVLKSKLHQLQLQGILASDLEETKKLCSIYEGVFNHKSFTGRSGTFFKYEGLGSIYWHMVSKLALAVQETYVAAEKADACEEELEALKLFYYNIKAGIGVGKSPDKYGAFPTDPYSHTPCFSGVQQPGMTGQVKEDILSRFGELGVRVEKGEIVFNSHLLNKAEFLENKACFYYYDTKGENRNIELEAGSLGFTYCQVPIVYKRSDSSKVVVYLENGEKVVFTSMKLNKEYSTSLFGRDGIVNRIEVSFKC